METFVPKENEYNMTKERQIMACGCIEDGTFKDNYTPLYTGCTLHHCAAPLIPQPDLSNRLARCKYGCTSTIQRSTINLQFFKYKSDSPYDEFYCGCFSLD